MTNWDKIAPTLQKLFPKIEAEEFATILEDSMSYLGGEGYRCTDGCTAGKECMKNDKSCWINVMDWLMEEAEV